MKKYYLYPLFLAQVLTSFPALCEELDGAALMRDYQAALADPKYSHLKGKAKLIAYMLDHLPASDALTLKTKKAKPVGSSAATDAKRSAATAPDASDKPAPAEQASAPKLPLPPGWYLALRKDFADIGPVARTNQPATGATINYVDDRVGRNVSWQLQGTTTVGYSIYEDDSFRPDLHLHALIVGGYFGIDKYTNTNSKPNTPTRDNLSYGGFAEFAFERTPDTFDYLRFKAGSVTNNIATRTIATVGKTQVTVVQPTTQFSASGEWIPVYTWPALLGVLPVHAPYFLDGPFGKFGVRFDPELTAQYDNTYDPNRPLAFSNRSEAIRLGPQAGLLLAPFFSSNISLLDSLHLKNLTVYSVYHWFHEFVSANNMYSFQTNLNYKFSEKGGLGFTLGYQRGNDEITGKYTNMFKVGLTGQI